VFEFFEKLKEMFSNLFSGNAGGLGSFFSKLFGGLGFSGAGATDAHPTNTPQNKPTTICDRIADFKKGLSPEQEALYKNVHKPEERVLCGGDSVEDRAKFVRALSADQQTTYIGLLDESVTNGNAVIKDMGNKWNQLNEKSDQARDDFKDSLTEDQRKAYKSVLSGKSMISAAKYAPSLMMRPEELAKEEMAFLKSLSPEQREKFTQMNDVQAAADKERLKLDGAHSEVEQRDMDRKSARFFSSLSPSQYEEYKKYNGLGPYSKEGMDAKNKFLTSLSPDQKLKMVEMEELQNKIKNKDLMGSAPDAGRGGFGNMLSLDQKQLLARTVVANMESALGFGSSERVVELASKLDKSLTPEQRALAERMQSGANSEGGWKNVPPISTQFDNARLGNVVPQDISLAAPALPRQDNQYSLASAGGLSLGKPL
jgi:hypothetical protein